jgi:hypothetical protein
MAITKTKVSLPGMNLSPEEEAIRVDVFWKELQVYQVDKVEKAFEIASKRLKFFPTLSDILDFLSEEDEFKEDQELLEWKPSEEGKEKARELLRNLKERWKREDEEREKKRAVEFEKSRKKLQAQAKLIRKENCSS